MNVGANLIRETAAQLVNDNDVNFPTLGRLC